MDYAKGLFKTKTIIDGDEMNKNLTPIALAVTTLMFSFAAQAQQASQPTTTDQTQVDQVVVSGIRASLQKSLEQKRNSDSPVEIITAEDVGKMPDKNVADSLSRVPGVNVETAGGTEGAWGENDRVSMRGTPATMTLTTLNGHSVSTGDWLPSDITASDRSVSYTLLPSEIIDRVTVYKGSQANLVEGGAVGTVDIETRKPLDFKQQLTVQGSVEGVYTSSAKKTDPQASGLINWKNDENNFGVMVQLFSEKREIHREGQEFLWWGTVNSLWGNNTAVLAANPGLSGADITGLTGSELFNGTRTTKGGDFDIQYKPNAAFSIDFNGFGSRLDATNSNYNQMQDVFNSITSGGISPTSFTKTGSTITSYTMPSTCPSYVVGGCGNVASSVIDMYVRPDAYSESQYYDLNLKYRMTDDFTVSSKLGHTSGTGHSTEDLLEVWSPYAGGSYTTQGLNGAATIVAPGSNAFPTTPSTVGCGTAVCAGGDMDTNHDSETYFHLDGKYNTHLDVIPTVEFGFRYSDHKRSLDVESPVVPAAAGLASNLPFYGLTNYPSNFGSGLGGSPLAGGWMFTPSSVTNWASTYLPSSVYTTQAYQSEFKIDEPTEAIYAMARVSAEALSGNFGVRIVNSKEDVTNYSQSGAPTNYDNTYFDVLPSANFRLDLTKDLVGRFSLGRTMARPEFGALGGLSLQDIQQTGTGGNPNLKPIKSNNLDTTLEWYFAPKSLASVGVYYMDLTSYVGYGVVNQTYFTTAQNYPKGAQVGYAMTVPVNTTGTVKGLELSLEMPVAGNFGFSTTFNLNDARDTGDGPTAMANGNLIGASKQSGNLSGYYEDDRFNARLTYSYRSSNFVGLDSALPFYQAGSGTLAASLGYKINEHLALSLDAQNLNDPKLRYYAQNEDEMRAVYRNGSQYYLTLRGKM